MVDGLRRQTVTAAGTTNFIWDGQDVAMETDGEDRAQSLSTDHQVTQLPGDFADAGGAG